MKTTIIPFIMTFAAAPLLDAQIQYSHGNPTADEQYMLELINRARSNPKAEGERLATSDDAQVKFGISYFGVSVARLRKDFSSYAVRPPLAMNANLTSSARRHSKDMAVNNFQSHTGSDKSTITSRINSSGYRSLSMSENIYSNLVSSVYFAHAGFAIDWGRGDGGLYPGLGHRLSIMGVQNDYREVGIGIMKRSGADATRYGEFSITQDFGKQVDSPVFLLGVAYRDSNGNGLYDPGEGLSGIRVEPSVGKTFAVTSASGGYAIPFTAATGAAQVVFSGGGLTTPVTRAFSLVRENLKVDLVSDTPANAVTLSVKGVDTLAGESKASGGTALFRIMRTGAEDEIKVTLKRPTGNKIGTAEPADYKISVVKPAKISTVINKSSTFVVTLPKGADQADVKITAVKDKKVEPKEKVKFSLVKKPSYEVGKTESVTITIRD
ncbi:MAG: CAP domain-containing protein [Verrucomicrobiaceae bacterium]|nr:MAG: CAP domain-containing protein [Verrucomicrobiaceae bacterium]